MPIQQITVVPARETANNGKRAPRSKDKTDGRKAPGRSGSRSSNISKASNSTGLSTASRTSIAPSSQDICSTGQLTRLDEDPSESHDRHTHTPEVTVTGAALGSSAATQKKQVKRRRRRKRRGCSSPDCVEPVATRDASDRRHSSDRSEGGERRERSSRSRTDLPPRHRCSESTSEDEAWREARSWSKEKARRVRCRAGSSQERNGQDEGEGGDDRTEVMELQSVDSDEEMESRPRVEEGGGPKKRRGSGASTERDDRVSQPQEDDESDESHSSEGSSSVEDDGEKPVGMSYQENGSGGGDVSGPTPQTHGAVDGGTQLPCSDDSELEVCRICHCEGDDECPLIMPCRCTGSLSFVHQACLNQWIKSSDTRCCELCKFDFVMETRLKPLLRWEKLHMSRNERRKIFCSVLFHLIAIVCMLWSVYVLVKRTAEEIRLGKNEELWRVSLVKYYTPAGVLEWPFWTKLIVVAIGFTGGLIFMYIQCKVYLQLWRRLKAFNRIITVQNCPEKARHNPQARTSALTNGGHEAVEVPVSPAPVPAPEPQTDSDMSVEAAVAPVQNPV